MPTATRAQVKLYFGILGPLEARRSDAPLELGPPKQKAVLAALLISPNRVLSLDRLIEMLWGEEVPARAQGSLQAYIYNLRKVLEPHRAVRSPAQVLVTRPPGYVLQVEPDLLDASRFESLASQGHRLLTQAHPAAAKEHLTQALALWRGPALAEFAFEHFAQPEAARLEQVRAVAHEDLLEVELALGNHAGVVGDITVAVGEHPLRERLWSLLMLALYRSGRQADALRAFAMARHTLAEELGIDPSPALRSLEAAILAQSPDLEYYRPQAWTEDLPPPTAGGAQGVAQGVARAPNTTALVGRENELRILLTAMSRAQAGEGRVVMVSGEAGIGKSRLAEELSVEAELNKCPVVWGRAHEHEGAPPHWLWSQVVANLLARSEPEILRRALARRQPVLRPFLPDRNDFVDPAENQERPAPESPRALFALHEAMTDFLVDLAEPGLLIVILEDIQWADESSLRLLEHLSARLQSSHLLVVATSQPPEFFCARALTETIGALARIPTLDWIELEGLKCPEVGRLIAQNGARASSAHVTDIHARTDGNPFFVLDFARLLATRDVPGPYHPGLIPNGARAVIRRRLGRLPDQTQKLLVVAAAMGREFDIATVAAAGRAKLNDAIDWVHPAVRVGVLTEDMMSPGTFRFAQDLVRDTLRRDLPGLRRRALHSFANRTAGEREESDADDGDHADRPEQACG